MIKAIVKTELAIYFRNLNSIFLPLIFFFLILSVFPLILGTDKILLGKVIPGMIWITVILTTLLSSNNFFRDDYKNGVIETYLTSDTSIELVLFFRIIACWIFTCLPVIVLFLLYHCYLKFHFKIL